MELVVAEAGLGALGVRGGRVLASGAGWAWLRTERAPVHLTGARGPRGPLTSVVDRVPVLRPGDQVRLDLARARAWSASRPPPPAPRERIEAACAAVRAYVWNEPRALGLGLRPLAEAVADLAGRGPGLTPAGDDVLLGYVLARVSLEGTAARAEAASVLLAIRQASGEPSRSLARWAGRGEAFEPAGAMLAALLRADGPGLGTALRRLSALGRTTGPAILTGLVVGLLAPSLVDRPGRTGRSLAQN